MTIVSIQSVYFPQATWWGGGSLWATCQARCWSAAPAAGPCSPRRARPPPPGCGGPARCGHTELLLLLLEIRGSCDDLDHDNQPRVTCLLHSRVNRAINIPSVRLLQVALSLCHLTNQNQPAARPWAEWRQRDLFYTFPSPAQRLVSDV